jgi:hypothetical protein
MKARHTARLFSLRSIAPVFLLAFGPLGAAPAQAADEEPAQIEDGLEENGLQERGPKADKSAPADPDPTLDGKVETRRKEIRELLNAFQEQVGNKKDDLTPADAKAWDKIVTEAGKLVQQFMDLDEKYIETRGPVLDRYRAAFGNGQDAEAAKVAKEVAKVRGDMLAKLEKLQKQADKVKGDWAKLEARIQKNADK